MRRTKLVRLVAVSGAAGLLLAIGPVPPANAAGGPNLAAGRPASASSANGPYVATNLNDGDQSTYWESANNAFPQWAQVDLGSATAIDQVVLKLPAGWGARTQTLSVASDTATIVSAADYVFDPAAHNTVTINFGAATTRYLRVNITANTGWPAGQLAELEIYGAAGSTTNLAQGKAMSASSATAPYVAGNANDGNQSSYWESANNAFPQWLEVDLGASVSVTRVVLKLPVSGWGTRTETLSVAGDGATIVASAAYVFDPASGNTVTITFAAAITRHLRLNITANTGWPAGQVGEFEVYGPATGDTQPPTAPTGLAFTEPTPGQIQLSWHAATDNVGVTGYDIYANNALLTSVPGTALSYTDSQPVSATVSYFVRARDAAGNQSGNSNTVTRTGSGGGGGSNLAVGKPITASSFTYIYQPANANDNDVTTYWESAGGGYPATLTVSLGANADVSSVVVKLNPDPAWGPRTQTIEVLGREQSATNFSSIKGSALYPFDPASGNTVSIPVSARVADVQLRFTTNSGAPGGQAAEFQVIGVPAPNPDLTVTASSWSPASPLETDPVTVSATVQNIGTASAGASAVNFYLGSTKVGSASVGALSIGASTTVSAAIGTQAAGSYPLTAKVDEANTVIELNDGNNAYTNPNPLVVSAVQSSDLVASAVNWTPGNPSAGNAVTFSVAVKNQGTVASAGGTHGITLTLKDIASGATVATLTGSYGGVIGAGVTVGPVNLGTWTAVNGKYTAHVVIAVDANELPVKQGNNSSDTPVFVGRGANMPYDMYEAEDGTLGGGAGIVGPNRTIGDLGGEASGRRAVTLNSTGAFVRWTTRANTNTLVVRFSIPDSPGGGGTTASLDIYVNDTFLKSIDLTSRYAWLYGAETGPGNSPGAGSPRHIYDEANVLLGTTVPAGSTIKLQKDGANQSQYAIDFVSLEQVAPIGNPNPATYTTPAGFTQQDVQNALDRARMDTTLAGVYLPPGEYQTANKFQVYGRAIKVVGAGPWYTHFDAPSTMDNTDVGIAASASANGSTFSGFAYFGNYTSRIDGPGKVFDFTDVSNMTIDNVWVEHQVVMFWGTHVDHITITNSRIRDTFADGINMTNGSQNNLVSNNEARSTGDDSFALFAATDHNSADLKNNTFQNLTAILTWRAAGMAVYGGYANTFENLYIADTLVYSGITISSLDFGYPFTGFGASPPTQIQNASIVRAGGHFWGAQTFPGIWCFSASKAFQGIRVSNVDITDPTYTGIMFQTNYVGGQPQNPVTDTVFTDISISGARQSGDALNAKSGFAIWANPMPEDSQGPAVGSVTFNHVTFSNNFVNIQNTTSTFTITVNP